MVNLNKVAVEICEREGGHVNLPIAQVKEVMRHFIDVLTEHDLYDVILCLNRHGEIEGIDTRKKQRKLKNFLEKEVIY